MNACESENYLAISRSSSASKSVEISWAEIYRGQIFCRVSYFEMGLPKDYPSQIWFNLVQWFNSSHLEWRAGLSDTILKWDYPRTIYPSQIWFARWLLLLKIEISSFVHCCFIINQNELIYFNCSYMTMSSLTYSSGFSVKF
jgi:hypothetical protein